MTTVSSKMSAWKGQMESHLISDMELFVHAKRLAEKPPDISI